MDDPRAQFDLAGLNALVIGASSGLGARFAEVLSKSGAAVAVAARRTPLLEKLAAQIQSAGGSALPVTMDVTRHDDIEAGFLKAEAALGPLSILVNSAGILVQKRAVDHSAADLDIILATNTKGTWMTCQAFARRLMQRGAGGSIVNIASMAGGVPMGGIAAYGSSKAAVIHMTKTLALEWMRYGINVNAISPGYIRTPINAGLWETQTGQKIINALPRQRIGTPDVLDGVLLLLASPASRFVTGAIINVDDGQSLVV